MSRRKLVQHLRACGCVLDREGSDHAIRENPANGRRTAVPRHREIPNFAARAICRQLGNPDP